MSCAVDIVTGPLEVYWAPVGEAMTAVNATPAGNWVQIAGSSQSADRTTDDGVHILSDPTTNDVMSLANILPECVLVTEQSLRVTLVMFQHTTTALRAALNFNAVTNDAGPPDINHISLNIGSTLNSQALLVRGTGKSGDFSGGNLQFEFPAVVSIGAYDFAYTKGEPVGAALEFRALQGTNRLVMQNA